MCGNVELPRTSISTCYADEWKLLPRYPGQIGSDLGNRVPEQLLYLILRQAGYLHPGYPRQLPAHHLRIGQGVAGPPLLADLEVIEALTVAGIPQLAAALTDRHTRPPLRPPVRAVVLSGRRAGLPFLDVEGFVGRDPVVVLGEPVGLLAVEVDPFDAVGVAATHGHHVHRRHRCLPYPQVVGPQVSHPACGHDRQNAGAADNRRSSTAGLPSVVAV